MNRCNKCNVNVYESEQFCPLCHTKMEEAKESIVEYPKYKSIIREKSPLRNIPLFSATTISILCVYINIFTHQEGDTWWSIVAASSMMCATALFNVVTSQIKRYGSKVIHVYVLISTLVIIIDFTYGMYFWSTNYVFPFLTLLTVAYLTVLALRSKRYFSEYFGYILGVIAIDIVSTVLDVIIFKNTSWGALITVVSSVIVTLGLYLFSDKSLKSEIKKRFDR